MDVFASALALPFSPHSFDAVLCIEVLEHTTDPYTSIEEIARVLNESGSVMITAPLNAPLHEEPNDYFRFTKYGLRFLIERAGLEANRVMPLGGTWLSFGQRLSGFLYRALGARTGTMGEQIPRPIFGPVITLICAAIQMTAAGIETFWYEEAGTMGYAIMAEKPISRASNNH